ncbi:toll/interleukin-1 receptor domain-containing protein [Brasilonema sp. CT11]|nr:toll/interleukin-1 receptor domain-containing protein [Brasilonema sp. CT11]
MADQNPEAVHEALRQIKKIHSDISRASNCLWEVSQALDEQVKESQPSSLAAANSSSSSLKSNVTPLSSHSVTTPDTDSAEQSSTSSDSSAPDSPIQPSKLEPTASQSNPIDLPDTSPDKLSTSDTNKLQGDLINLVNADAKIQLLTQHSQKKSKKGLKFDVFLCHNTEDKPLVEEIGKDLIDRKIIPWFDVWELRPGTSWQDTLEKQLKNIKSAAIFVGQSGIGPWQKIELKGFILEFMERKLPVIPVILRGAETPKIPPLLKDNIWVDFREKDSIPMERLIWGIRGIRPPQVAPDLSKLID